MEFHSAPLEGDPYLILLYYLYSAVVDPGQECIDQLALCERLELNGRIRVATEGINGTLGGSPENVMTYTREMDSLVQERGWPPIHWKTSALLPGIDRESQKFKSLSAKVTKEVVSMDLKEEELSALIDAGGANHLSPSEFHTAISKALEGHPDDCEDYKKMVIIDVRNIYETRIGRFDISDHDNAANVTVLDPKSRQFSEFRQYIDKVSDELQDKKVLMYCTGGVRCERASAYLRSKGVTDVHQLFGGIHQYQQDFPSGGFFKGKNFVYDPRIAVPYPDVKEDQIVGSCQVCSFPYDDYRAQLRCPTCRMLVLVCDTCQERLRADDAEASVDPHNNNMNGKKNRVKGVLCENCSGIADKEISIVS